MLEFFTGLKIWIFSLVKIWKERNLFMNIILAYDIWKNKILYVRAITS